jgi:hypothetical protein
MTGSPQPSRFFATFVAASAFFLAGVAATNFAIDAAGAFFPWQKSRQNAVAAYVDQLQASTEGLVRMAPDWPIKLELATRSKADCVVIGSSHVMPLNHSRVPLLAERCHQVVNLGVTGGSFEEAVTFLHIVAGKPRDTRLFIEIPPWFLNRIAHVDFADHYDRARAVFGLPPAPATWGANRWIALINFDYLRFNIRETLAGRGWKSPEARAVVAGGANLTDDDFVSHGDGSHTYPRRILTSTLPAGYFAQRKPNPPRDHLPLFEPAARPDRVGDLTHILVRLKERGLAPTLLLMPYHPTYFDCMAPEICRWLETTEAAAVNIARWAGVDVLGSYDPRRLGIGAGDFLDDHHLRLEGFAKMTGAAWGATSGPATSAAR